MGGLFQSKLQSFYQEINLEDYEEFISNIELVKN